MTVRKPRDQTRDVLDTHQTVLYHVVGDAAFVHAVAQGLIEIAGEHYYRQTSRLDIAS